MPAVRPATTEDIPELVRHRELLFTAMGHDMTGPSEWREAATRTFKEGIGGDSMAVLVVDGQYGLDGPYGLERPQGRDRQDGQPLRDGQDRPHGRSRPPGRARLAASGIGVIDRRLPGPRTPNGRWGHVSGIVTDPAFRRRGHARAVMIELLAWFHDHEIGRIDLHATPDAEGLYRALGFTEHHGTALTWTAVTSPPGT